MKKVLIAYLSHSGNTENMAQYVAEGVRITGQEAEVRKVSEINTERDLAGYDGYVFGSPTYHLGIPQNVEAVLDLAEKANLAGKVGGAFGYRAHPSSGGGDAPGLIFQKMESRLKMKMTNLGALDMKGGLFEGAEDMRACQDYGRVIGEMLV
jgi:flavodoxin